MMISDKTLLMLRRVVVCLKRIPGFVLLLEPLRRYFSRTKRRITVDDFDGSMKMILQLDEHMQSQIFWYGYYCRDIVLVMDRILQPGMVVLDVGANIGEITVTAARRVAPAGRVYSFEPMPTLFPRLKEHVQINKLQQITPAPIGLSDRNGTAILFRSNALFSDGTRNDGLGTLYAADSRADVAGEIELTTLDEFCTDNHLSRIDLLKIDVEGAELAVLRGGLISIKRFQPYLIVEVQPDTAQNAGYNTKEIVALIKSLEYRIFVIGRKARLRFFQEEDLLSFHNVLCVPKGADIP